MPSIRFEKINFQGIIRAVKPRIRLIRSYDEMQHAYLGYVLVMQGAIGSETNTEFKLGIGEKTHLKYQFRIGDEIKGLTVLVENPKSEWAEYYKVSGLEIIRRGTESETRPPDPKGGLAPALEVYRTQGHLRLDPKTYEKNCQTCPWGIVMATEMIIDHWNPEKKKWRYETHCYNPRNCEYYRPGRARVVQGRKPEYKWVDDDYERATEEKWNPGRS